VLVCIISEKDLNPISLNASFLFLAGKNIILQLPLYKFSVVLPMSIDWSFASVGFFAFASVTTAAYLDLYELEGNTG
jgi:hypothetical protein